MSFLKNISFGMDRTFFYTFRTNRFVGELEEVLDRKVFVLDKYSKDFGKLLEAIKLSGAGSACGIGMIKRGESRFEEFAFNKIGRFKIDLDAPERIKLTPSLVNLLKFSRENGKLRSTGSLRGSFVESGVGMTFGPCNYVAFRISLETGLKNSFLHLNPKDINKLKLL